MAQGFVYETFVVLRLAPTLKDHMRLTLLWLSGFNGKVLPGKLIGWLPRTMQLS